VKVYLILDEFILAGELQETSKRVRRLKEFFISRFMIWDVFTLSVQSCDDNEELMILRKE